MFFLAIDEKDEINFDCPRERGVNDNTCLHPAYPSFDYNRIGRLALRFFLELSNSTKH